MEENFLLTTELARQLYHDCAKQLPIIDYHNHLNMKELSENQSFENLARLWLISDPYKHRAMRICGVEERYITGDAADFEKFSAWMSVLPKLVGNPLYDWSVLEMKRIFGIELQPGCTDIKWLWEKTGKMLALEEYRPLSLLKRFGVEYAAPCALLTDDISAYLGFEELAPSLRGDDIAEAGKETADKLERITGISIRSLADYCKAVSLRLKEFHRAGCRFSDHALDDGFTYFPDDGKNELRFERLKQGESLEPAEQQRLTCRILRFLAGKYAEYGWTMQLHIGAQRFTSSRLRRLAGPAGGFAGIGSCCDTRSLTQLLDDFEKNDSGMPDMILFTLNPADNAVMSVLSGSYSQDGVAGKVQQGPAWWWCDHLYGIREVFESISSFGVLSVFLGMTTDSRSILSFVRHEYFRRALCGWIGDKVQKGEIYAPKPSLEEMVRDICYGNVKRRINGKQNCTKGEEL